jgi:hypothetical protein
MESAQTPTPSPAAPVQKFTLMTPEQIKQKAQTPTPAPQATTVSSPIKAGPGEPAIKKPSKTYTPSYKREVIYKHSLLGRLCLLIIGGAIGIAGNNLHQQGLLPTNLTGLQSYFKQTEIIESAEPTSESQHAAPTIEGGVETKESGGLIGNIKSTLITSLPKTRNEKRKSDLQAISSVLTQYMIEYGTLPDGITTEPQEICSSVSDEECEGLLMLHSDLAIYLKAIPQDPRASGHGSRYFVSKQGGGVLLSAPDAELDVIIEVN